MENRVEWAEEFEDYVNGLMNECKIPGMAVAVSKGSRLIYSKGFGVGDRETGAPVEPDTIFGIASITKSFTAAAIMRLADEGKVAVTDPVVEYLPEFRVPDEDATAEITIHHFLTHLSGLPPQPNLGRAMKASMEGYPKYNGNLKAEDESATETPPVDTYEQLLERLGEDEYQLLGRPGDQLSYSNDAYALLGAIVERVSGQSYESYVQENILEPNHMDRTAFSIEEAEEWGNVTRLYFKNSSDEVLDVPRYQEAPSFVGAGFLRSTAPDLVKYGNMYLRGGMAPAKRVLSEESVARMETPVFPTTPPTMYAYGLMVTPHYHGVTLVEHGGSLTGVSSNFGYVPEADVACAILMNLSGAPSGEAWLAAVNLALGLPLDTRRVDFPECTLTEEELQRFVGRYTGGEGQDVEIALEDGQLVARSMGDCHPMRPAANDTLVVTMRGRDSAVRFDFDEDGTVRRAFFGLRLLDRMEESQ